MGAPDKASPWALAPFVFLSPALAYWAVRQLDARRFAESYHDTLEAWQSSMLLLPRSWVGGEHRGTIYEFDAWAPDADSD